MKEPLGISILFPLLAVVTIVVFAGGLGITFMVLESVVPETWGVIVLGTALVLGVPAVAALLQMQVEKE
jgi:hypothetical protein